MTTTAPAGSRAPGAVLDGILRSMRTESTGAERAAEQMTTWRGRIQGHAWHVGQIRAHAENATQLAMRADGIIPPFAVPQEALAGARDAATLLQAAAATLPVPELVPLRGVPAEAARISAGFAADATAAIDAARAALRVAVR